MNDLWQLLSFGFMHNALLAGVLASVACGVIGSLVVVNRMVFLAGGIAHAAYGGVGLSFFLGWPALPCTLGFTAGASLLMGAVTRSKNERTDTVVGVLWAAGMATGIILIDLSPGYAADLMGFLFGSILAVPATDLWVMLVLDLLVIGLTAFFYHDLLAMSFDTEFAEARGAPVVLLHYLLPLMTALCVVMIVRVVGLILVIALVTIPPYLAERKARSLAGMMLRACLWSLLFCTLGLLVSALLDITSGACIIAVAAGCFFLLTGWDGLRKYFAGQRS
ncbi:zinc transport system permease protein [Paucidesulfovibrio gracilis DSM 16080]|uniref:Zinc transport system permease protein n=1 Tax=Paucidesulfovibrio gracilis DSM 16080 TaxID=1121449 RepID=A0A1T4Y3R5_9BACT|nr:metal ABC transporter permease [Paucidesulfovibrio gracilis]SKA96474.1 zinc transport system permease protein [Paucidesulfovibrio gracilis DSM 16080]